MSDIPTFKSTGFQHLDAKIERSLEQAYKLGFDDGIKHQKAAAPPPKARELAKQLEAMRERAESAEARIAEVSGVTREALARREYERGLAEGRARRSELLVELRGWMAQHCCGCGHPACKRCADDNAAAALVARVES